MNPARTQKTRSVWPTLWFKIARRRQWAPGLLYHTVCLFASQLCL